MDEINLEWAEWLKQTRIKEGLTMDQLAKAAKVSRTTLSRIEKKDPSVQSLSKRTIAKISGVLTRLTTDTDISTYSPRSDPETEEASGDITKLPELKKAPIGVASRIFSNLASLDPKNVPDVLNFLQSLGEAIAGDSVFSAIAQGFWDQTRLEMNQLAIGRVTINPNPLINLLSVAIEHAEKDICATSMVLAETWWLTEEGQMYHRANIKMAKEVEVTRIYLKDTNMTEDDWKHSNLYRLMKEQQEAHVKVLLLNQNPEPWMTPQDVIIIDSNLSVTAEISPTGSYKPTQISRIKSDIDKAKRLFSYLEDKSVPFDG